MLGKWTDPVIVFAVGIYLYHNGSLNMLVGTGATTGQTNSKAGVK